MWYRSFWRRLRRYVRQNIEGAPYAVGAIFLAIEGIREMREVR